MNHLMLFFTFLVITSLAYGEPAPTPTPLSEPGMDTKAPKNTTGKKLPRAAPPKIPPGPAGPTPFDPGNAPVVK